VKNLVVLAQFADHADTLIRAPSDYTTLMNAVGGDPTLAPTGSVRDVWKENSYQTLDLVSTVQNWVRLPFTEAYYADNNQGATILYRDQMVTDALAALDATVNFANFDTNNDGYVDAVDVIHSGYASEWDGNPRRIWSKQWTLANDWVSNDKNANGVNVKVSRVHTEPALWDTTGRDICHIGVIAHETGHFFGLPDLYDQDEDGAGAGNWCLMANSWGWSNDQRYPPELCAWSKIQLGYIHPTTVPLSTASYVVSQQETSPQAYRVDWGYSPNEYLLIECRKPVGFDHEIPQGGLAIWHIDDNIPHDAGAGFNQNQGYPGMPGWPGNGAHYGDALLQADGRYDLEKLDNVNGDAGDLWHLGGNVMLNEVSLPNCDRYVTLFQPTGNEISVTGENATSETFFFRPGLWVDFSYGGFYAGTFNNPFNSLSSAINAAPDNWGIICKGGTTGERPTLTRPMTFRSWGGTTVVGP
jgi:M6 family metalloprotease-like protein